MQTIICMKWGSRYGPEFVNRLYKAIQRHTKRKTKLYCFTDDVANINKEVNWNFYEKAKQLEIGSEKFGYNIKVTENVSFGKTPISLYLRITNTKDHLFRGKLLIPNQSPVDLVGQFALEADTQSRKRVSRIFNHQACDEVISLALMSNGDEIDRIYGDSEEFTLPPSVRNSDEPVKFEIVGLNATNESIHTSDTFEILFLRKECGDSNATNYYDGINNDPDNSQCEEFACLDSNACNYESDPATSSGGSWIHDESLCNVTNNDGECCPEFNECGACGELVIDADTGMCEHGDRNGECPEGMVEDRCGKCFASETDEGFDECVGCTNVGDIYHDSNATEHDESMCAVCGDETACNYDSNATDLNTYNELCEHNTISNIEILPSLDTHNESLGYTKYNDVKAVFDSNIFESAFTSEDALGDWTIGDKEFTLSEGGHLVDQDGNAGQWLLYSTAQTLTAKQVNGAEWLRLAAAEAEGNTQKEYNLLIQTSDSAIYYINMPPFYSNPRSAWNVIKDGNVGQLEHKFMRKGALDEDVGQGCSTNGVDYQLLRRSTNDVGEEEMVVEASGDATSNTLSIVSSKPGVHILKLKPSCATCDENVWEASAEFTLMSESCAIKEADNYDNIFDTVDAQFAVQSLQNKLFDNGVGYMVPVSDGSCNYIGCNDEDYKLACNYSEHFVTSSNCYLPDYGKTCAGECATDPVTGYPLEDDCGDCHPIGTVSSDPRWNERCADCAGVASGPHIIDLCGTCVDRNSDDVNAECTDCAGVENGNSYLVYTDAKVSDATFICTLTEERCGDSNACNYDDAEDVNPLAINNDVCTYASGYEEGRQTADCDGNCLEGYTADCRGLCGLETDETYLIKDSCGWCGGSSQNCSPLNLNEGERWQVAASCDKNSSLYDPNENIVAMYKINNNSSERYSLLWDTSMGLISEVPLEPKTMLWIETKDGSKQDELDEIHFMNLTAIQQLAKDARTRLGHLGNRGTTMEHVLSKATNILDGASIRGYADELAVKLVGDESKQTVLAEVQINKRETNANGLVINNGEIDHFWMHIDGTCTVRLFHADMNNAGTVVQLVGPNGLTPIESRDESVEIIVGDNETEQDVWVKVQIQNRIDDGSYFTDLITDSNHEDFDEDRFNAEMEATKTSYETVIVAIERPGTKFTGADSKVNITYSLDGPDGIDA